MGIYRGRTGKRTSDCWLMLGQCIVSPCWNKETEKEIRHLLGRKFLVGFFVVDCSTISFVSTQRSFDLSTVTKAARSSNNRRPMTAAARFVGQSHRQQGGLCRLISPKCCLKKVDGKTDGRESSAFV